MQAVMIDMGATATEKGGMVFNVKAYGAVGDGLVNDTEAFKLAISAAASQVTAIPVNETATSGSGGIVFVPQGVYRIQEPLDLSFEPAAGVCQGVSIRGAGMHTSQIRFAMSGTQDGLVWSKATGQFGKGGFLEDIDIIAEGAAAPQTVQNLVVLSKWSNFAFNRVRLLGADKNNLLIRDCVNITATHLLSTSARSSNLYIDSSSVTSPTTTCRFVGCYFQKSREKAAADVVGLALSFDACIFESAAYLLPLEGAANACGILVRGGTVTLVAPYFEANRSWDLLAGTDVVGANSALSPSVTVINPVIMPLHNEKGDLLKVPGTGGFKFERGGGFVLGGNLLQSPRPLVFSNQMDMVQTATFPNVPAVEGGTFSNVPGMVLYKNGGQATLAGDLQDNTSP